MSAAKTCLAGLVLFSLTAAACTSDDAAEARARAEHAEARVETLGADLAEAEIALAEVQTDAEEAQEAAAELDGQLAAAQAGLHDKVLELAASNRELAALREEHDQTLWDLAILEGLFGQLEYRATPGCPLPDRELPAQDLPAAVAQTRSRIHAAAVACDWRALSELARAAGGIAYSDGAVGWRGDPVPYWLVYPEELRLIAGVLEMPFGVRESQDENGNPITVYIWPAVAMDEHRTEADWSALGAVYSAEEIARIRESGEGYAGGFVVAVRSDGTWRSALHVSV